MNKLASFIEMVKTNYPELYTAVRYHRTHKNKPITFGRYMYMRRVYLDKNPNIVMKKCTQVGVSEYLIVRAIMRSAAGRGIFYILPTEGLVSRFVRNRLDRSIGFTPYYKKLVMQSGKRNDSVSLKHIGKGSIAFIGSNASSGFTEYPADDVFIDELDECDPTNLNMAVERLSASESPAVIKVGNPTILGYGVDDEYSKSDMKEWRLKCPHCNTWQTPDFFLNVVEEMDPGEYVYRDEAWRPSMDRDVNMVCVKCKKAMDRFTEGEWVAKNTKIEISGYHISKLFSTNVSINDLIERFNDGLHDNSKMQRFYNGDLGLAYTSSGAKLNYDMLDECREKYIMPQSSKRVCVMGVDVGTKLHTIIAEIMPDKRRRLVFIGTVIDKEDIFDLWERYHVRFGVIDAMPEGRLAKEICGRLKGMFRCFYGEEKVEKVDLRHKIITIDRTASLDAVKEDVLLKTVIIPQDARMLHPISPDGVSEFYFEMCASTRVFNEKRETYEWVHGGKPDHFCHAWNYMGIAMRVLIKAVGAV